MKSNIYKLLGSRACTEVGLSLYSIIIPLVILDISGSIGKAGLFFSITKIPSIILLPFLGVFIDKFNKQQLIMICNLLTALIFAILYVLFSSQDINFVLLATLGIGIDVLSSITNISSGVLFTELVPKNELEKYNGTKSVLDNSAIFIAPMVGTLLYGVMGIGIVIGLMFCCYLSGFLGVRMVQYTPVINKKVESLSVLEQMKEGLTFLKSDKPILAFFILITTLNFFVASSEEIINPGILISKYAIPKEIFGFSSTFYIAGVILASMFIIKKRDIKYQELLPKLFVINSIIMMLIGILSILLYGLSNYVYYTVFLILQVVVGFVTILINVPLNAYFQANVPSEFLSRFFSFLTFAASLSIPFGITYTGFLAQYIGADYAYIINNLCVIVLVVLVYRNIDIHGMKHTNG